MDLVDLDPKEYVGTLDLLKKIDILQGVSEDILRDMLFSLQTLDCKPNKTILFQGEISNKLYIVRQGSVVITTKNKGTKLVLAELKAVMYFGEISLLRPVSATATVTAGEQGANLLVLSHEAVNLLTRKFSDIKDRIQTVIDTRIASKKQAKDADENAEN